MSDSTDRLKKALAESMPSRAFEGVDAGKVAVSMFYGSSINPFESVLFREVRVAAAASAEQTPVMDFILAVRDRQGARGQMHNDMTKFLAARKDSLSIDTEGNLVIHNGEHARTLSGAHEHADTLAILYMLRFGAFHSADDTDIALTGAVAALVYLFKGTLFVNAQNALYTSISRLMTERADDVDNADNSLLKTRELEGNTKIAKEKTLQELTHARSTLLESATVGVLAITLLVCVWLRGMDVVTHNRTAAIAGTVAIFLYLSSRMVWLHVRVP
jgi:hypothetical protein